MTEIRALTIRQPWAWAIAVAGKTVENRGWSTNYRGLLAIHAGKGMDDPYDLPGDALRTYQQAGTGAASALGAVVAVAHLADCHTARVCADGGGQLCSPWAVDGQWHWELTNVGTLARPVPCRGALGLWRLPPEVETAVRDQIGAAK